MKRALTSAMRSGAKGVKVQVSGASAAPRWRAPRAYSDGRVPLHTMRADIDYGFYEARTTFGRIGVKCWINKGEIMPEGYTGADLTDMSAPAPASATTATSRARARRARRSRRPRRRGRGGGGGPGGRGGRGRGGGPGGRRRPGGGGGGARTRTRRAGGRRPLMLAPKRVKHRKQHRGRRARALARAGARSSSASTG